MTYPNRVVIDQTFDAASRPSAIRMDGAAAATYAYSNGRLATKSLGNGVGMQLTYDDADQLTRLAFQGAYVNMAYNMTYDRDGHVETQIVEHAPNLGFHAGYDSIGRLVSFNVGNVDERIIYTPTPLSMPNADAWAWRLDGQNNWLSATKSLGTAAPTTTTNTYNAENRYQPASSWLPMYDQTGDLKRVQGNTGDGDAPDTAYTYDGFHRLRMVETTKFTQQAGAPSCGTEGYPPCVTYSQGGAKIRTSYTYDAAGRRTTMKVEQLTGGYVQATYAYFYAGPNVVEMRRVATSTEDYTYVQGAAIDEHILYTKNGGTKTYFLQDRLATVLALTDASGKPVEAYTYDPYGAVTVILPGTNGVVDWGNDDTTTNSANIGATLGARGNVYFYTGQQYDASTKLYYYRARFYDPTNGRFLSQDPIGNWGDHANFGNGYGYVGGMPLRYNDPFGLCGWGCWSFIVAVVVVVVVVAVVAPYAAPALVAGAEWLGASALAAGTFASATIGTTILATGAAGFYLAGTCYVGDACWGNADWEGADSEAYKVLESCVATQFELCKLPEVPRFNVGIVATVADESVVAARALSTTVRTFEEAQTLLKSTFEELGMKPGAFGRLIQWGTAGGAAGRQQALDRISTIMLGDLPAGLTAAQAYNMARAYAYQAVEEGNLAADGRAALMYYVSKMLGGSG
jgi:RHS repeat-associated protein